MMEADMNNLTELTDRYFAVWSETDAERRRELIARTSTETASYLDPVMNGEGHAGIDAMIQGVQERFAGYRFRRRADLPLSSEPISASSPLTIACRQSPVSSISRPVT